MKLIIGGYAQGKLNYVLKHYELENYVLLDGTLSEAAIEAGNTVILHCFHLWVKDGLKRGANPEEEIRKFVKEYPDCIIISDEVGNGIVPIDAFEREYRERTGRMLVELAEKAEEVVRVICGMGQKIK
ncbi:MAG: bifunctional adenosylcobinamide kinase/adenosylcobinamide-phosphate guanylyltransferase [Lachnospiraceae bacterium]|nr:bifunctional adenosylcobinamide kinase/adenosylcobinamide-phosphate guanylyltransferase [Lachnospiraceae bacterium]